MKRVAIILCVAMLGLTACPESGSLGRPDDFDFEETVEPTASPTKTATVKPRKTNTTKPTPTKASSSYKPKKYTIKIRNVNDQYEPRERVLYEGDILVFQNLDPNSKHSLTEGSSQQEKNPAFDSGELDEDEKKEIKIKLAPGDYYFHCTVVPYIQGGPIRVLKNPRL